MRSALCKHRTRCGWGCLTYSILDTLGTPGTSHCLIVLGVLLNLPFCTLYYVWVHIVGAVPVSVKPVWMISKQVSAPPALNRGVEPTCCLSYGLLCHTHLHGGGLPVGILLPSLAGKLGVFLVPPVRNIPIMKNSFCHHEFHWRLFPRIFISRFCRS